MEDNNTQVLEDTTLTGTETVDDAADATDDTQVSDANADDSAAADGNDGADDGDDNAVADGTEPMLTIRYNHADKALSMAEAKELAQKGLKFDSMTDMLNDISYLAAIQGKTPAELIKGYIEAGENIRRQELIEKYGEDSEAVEVLMEKYRQENQKKFTAAKETLKQKEEAAEQDLNQRIADDFLKMKADFPELTDYAALPNEVKRQAANGTPLKYAYLDYKYAQEKATAAAKAQAEAAAKKSTGSMATGDGVDSAQNALLKGLWN